MFAFKGCSGLENLYCRAVVAPFALRDAFENTIYNIATLHVPANSVDAYRNTYPWSLFGTIVAFADDYPVEINGIWYNLITEAKEAEVTRYPYNSEKYSGNIEIPSSVTYNEMNFSVTSIDASAFSGCSDLTSVTIPNSVTSIGNSAFSVCSDLTSVTIPNSVTSIGGSAFGACSGLTSITIPNSVTSIGISAFVNCSGLTSVTIPNSVTAIGSETFYGCSGLTSVTIGNSVTSIGDYAFSGCSGLTSVTIPNNVISIGRSAFRDCSGLSSVTIPNSVTSIGDYVFSGCNALTSVTIPNSLTSIGKAFSGCSGLTSVTIPNSVTSIDDDAFRECISLTSVTIPSSVTTIGTSAFLGCSSLASIDIPNSVTDIAPFCFHYCSGLSSIKVQSDNPKYDSRNDCNAIIETSNNYLILGCKNTIIPNSVTTIGNYAFYNCSGLTSITIPNSVTTIGDYAFSKCSDLTSVTIPNSVTSIGREAFSGTEWYNNQSEGLLYLDNFLLGYKGTKPTGDIDIAEGTRGIAGGAFNYCWDLTSVTIPNSVTSIGYEAFFCCSNLTSVTISNSVTSIGYEAFCDCSSLKDFYCWAENVPYTDGGLRGIPFELATLHVPAASLDAYKNTAPWSIFENIVALTDDDPKPTSIGLRNTDTSLYPTDYFNLEGKRISKPQRGLNVIKMSDGTTKKMFIK